MVGERTRGSMLFLVHAYLILLHLLLSARVIFSGEVLKALEWCESNFPLDGGEFVWLLTGRLEGLEVAEYRVRGG